MSPKQTTLKAGSRKLQQCWWSVCMATSYVLFLTRLRIFSVIPLVRSLGFLWWETQRLHPCLTFLLAPYTLTGGRFEIMPSLGKSRSPCLGPLMSLLKTRHCHQTRNNGLETQTWAECESSCRQIVYSCRSCLLLFDATRRTKRSRARPSSNIGIKISGGWRSARWIDEIRRWNMMSSRVQRGRSGW